MWVDVSCEHDRTVTIRLHLTRSCASYLTIIYSLSDKSFMTDIIHPHQLWAFSPSFSRHLVTYITSNDVRCRNFVSTSSICNILTLPLFPFVRGEVLPATLSPPHLLVFSTLLCLLSSSSSLPPLLPSSHLS